MYFYLLRKNIILSLEFLQCYCMRDQAVIDSKTFNIIYVFTVNNVLMHFKF